jgi:hypothetical protein
MQSGGGERADEYAALVDARGCCVTPPDSALFVPDVVIKRSAIHGFGGFAGRAFRTGEAVLEYRGRMMSKTEGAVVCEKHDFVFIIDDEFDLDGLGTAASIACTHARAHAHVGCHRCAGQSGAP